jgi:hypothetical protein
MSYKYQNSMYSTTEVFTQETKEHPVVTHEAIQNYIHVYSPILSIYKFIQHLSG